MAAHAKGGGHGGGGGGHSSSHSSSSLRTLHSSRVSSSRRRSRSRSSGYSSSSRTYHSTTYASPPPPIRLFPNEASAREGEGFYCPATMPRPGEKVNVQGGASGYRTATVISSTPATQASLYGKDGYAVMQPVPGFDESCTVTVQYSDGTTGVLSAAEEPTPLWQSVGTLAAYGALTAATYALPDSDDVWESVQEKHDYLIMHLTGGKEAPPSGEYWGSSEESDEGDQAVRTTIRFRPDGTVTGRGKDGVDGAYRITRGRWGMHGDDDKVTVAWIEEYDEGFSVAVKGTYEARSGTIKARFTSDRGVSGSFELAPKPSIF